MLEQLIDLAFGQGPLATVRALAEIALLAYLVYQLFKELRGGRAVPMAVGILILIGGYWLAGRAGFTVIEDLLGAFAPYLALVLVVVFQDEIRSTLRELALRFVPAGRKTAKVYFELEDVVFAMSQLSASRVGALIVIERETGLRTFIQSGVALEARLSSDLLVSIFQRSSPLHDGGVIVREGRIAAAACFLPLTTSPGLAATLGTRHRAAIGVSEESDALALVVSETDGRISIASQGAIERGVTVDRLRLRMIERLGPVVSPPKGKPIVAPTLTAEDDPPSRPDPRSTPESQSPTPEPPPPAPLPRPSSDAAEPLPKAP